MSHPQDLATGKLFIDPEFLQGIVELLPGNHKFIKLLSDGDVLTVYNCLYALSQSLTLNIKQVLFLKKMFEEGIDGEEDENMADELYLRFLACTRADAFKTELDTNFFYHC